MNRIIKKFGIVVLLLIFMAASCEDATIHEEPLFKNERTMYLGITSGGSVMAWYKDVQDKDKIHSLLIPSKYAGIYVKEIKDSGFNDCVNLQDVSIEPGCSRIGDNAFENCTDLYKVVIPTTVKSIGKEVFKGCKKLEFIFYDGTKEEWNKISKGTNWKDIKRPCTIFYSDETNEII